MTKRTVSRKINVTKNYRLFGRSVENRPLDMKKHKKLMESMKLYGNLPCFPIVCSRDADKHLIVKDGQHRLAVAEALGLPVYWIEETVDFDVATVNNTQKVWQLIDYARKYAANGSKDYQEVLEFSETHRLPIGTSVALLSGTTGFSNVQKGFCDGTFKVRDRVWADAVASVYGPIVLLAAEVRNARFIEACMAACRVEAFDPKRMVRNAGRCRDKLASYSTRDAYLDMMETIYNFGCKQLLGLKAEATMAMRERSAVKSNGAARQGRPAKSKANHQ